MLYLLILIIPLMFYAALSAFILFHLKRYGIAGDLTKKLTAGFIAASLVLFIFSVWSFFNIPWKELNLEEIIQTQINQYPEYYQ